MRVSSPFLVELWLRTLARCALVCLLLPVVVVAIERVSGGGGSASGLVAGFARWLLELAPLAVALVVVDTVAEVEASGEGIGAASLGVSGWRWAVLGPALLVGLAVGATRWVAAGSNPSLLTRLAGAAHPLLGVVVAVSALALAPWLARALGLGLGRSPGRAFALVTALLVAAVILAGWRVLVQAQ